MINSRRYIKMKHSFTIITGLCLIFAAGPLQAYWTGNGDGTSWGDVDNWSEDIVPLTEGGADTATVNAASADVTVNIDASTANTFVDTTSANFLSTRAQDAGNTLNFNADWGDGYSAGAMWAGQSTNGTVNFNNIAGSLTTTGGTYLGRSSGTNGVVNFNISGGSVGFKEVSVGCRTDALADVTLSVSGGTLYLGQSGPTGEAGTIMGRSQHGAYQGGQTTKVSISGDATVVMNDTRLGGVAEGQGTDMFEVIGSNATITSDTNFYTCQQATYLGPCMVRFVADENGVSTIKSFDDDTTFRIAVAVDLEVDITNYTGYQDLVLVDFGPNRIAGAYEPNYINIIGGTADVIQDVASGDIYLTNINGQTSNQRPQVNAGADKQSYLSGGGIAEVALDDATVTDDDGPGPLTQTWSMLEGPAAVTFNPDENALNPAATFTAAGTYTLQLLANDGIADNASTVEVVVFEDGCAYAKEQPDFSLLTGDFNEDCIVDFSDFAEISFEWLISE
jgi:hypothetical protein